MNDETAGLIEDKISALTDTFTASYSTVVDNLQTNLTTMQRMNGLMENYVKSSLSLSLTVSSPSTIHVSLLSTCPFPLNGVRVVVALVRDDESVVALTQCDEPLEQFWAIDTVVKGKETDRMLYAVPKDWQVAPGTTILTMARFPSPASGEELEIGEEVPFLVQDQLWKRIVQSAVSSPSLASNTVDGNAWRRLFDVPPMQGMAQHTDVFEFSKEKDGAPVVSAQITAVEDAQLTLSYSGERDWIDAIVARL